MVERLRHICPDVPVLFTSGYTQDEVLRGASTDEQVALLAKPFSPAELLDAVRLRIRI